MMNVREHCVKVQITLAVDLSGVTALNKNTFSMIIYRLQNLFLPDNTA